MNFVKSLKGLREGSSSSGDAVVPDLDASQVWERCSESLLAVQGPQEKSFRDDVAAGVIPSPFNKVRLFNGDKEEDVRVTFYRDSASWCPYCQKVWMMLEEKEVSYKVEKVNMRCYGSKPGSFLRLQPSGNIPVAVMDGQTFKQSNDIMYALDVMFPGTKLMGLTEKDQPRGERLLRLERELFSKWMYFLTGSREPDRYEKEFLDCLKVVDGEILDNGSSSSSFFLGDRGVSLVDVSCPHPPPPSKKDKQTSSSSSCTCTCTPAPALIRLTPVELLPVNNPPR